LSCATSLTDNTGGYLVPFQLDPSLIITDAGTDSDIRRIARNVVATGDVRNGVSAAQISASWDAESYEASDDTNGRATDGTVHTMTLSDPYSL
jgi:HK97 family phage major capsid protein